MELFKAQTILDGYRGMEQHMNLSRRKKTVQLQEALGLRLYDEIQSPEDVPGFNRSTMDGYAVRAKDTFGASESMPAYLEVAGEVLMGKEATGFARPGQAWRISTGGMLPDGCDAVVMVEHTEGLGSSSIGVIKPVAPGYHMVKRGEDIASGEIILPKGQRVRPQELGVMASVGVTQVDVQEPLRVAILSTGDEVVEPFSVPGLGQVRDINSYTLYGLTRKAGAVPILCGVVGDDFASLSEAMKNALERADIVLLSGGSSVGTRDVSAKVIQSLGEPGVLFHGISVKPGKPTIGAVVRGTPVFGLPGHPVSAMVVFLLFVEPLIKAGRYPSDEEEFLMGFPVMAKITRNVPSAAGREDFIRVALRQEKDNLLADPVLGKSGLISTMAKADGLARIAPEREGVEAGELVRVKII